MKKIIAFIIFSAAFSISFAARNKVKARITESKLGSFDEFETASGTFKLKKIASMQLSDENFIVKFNPRKNTAGVYYKKLGLKERLVFDADARRTFLESYNAYLKDYSEKKLDRKSKEFNNAYGTARMRTDWGAFSYSNSAQPKAYFGYIFVGKSPYFAIRVSSMKSEVSHDGVTIEYSGALLYLTRSQASDLAEGVSEEAISAGMKSLISSNAKAENYDEDNSENDENADYVEE